MEASCVIMNQEYGVRYLGDEEEGFMTKWVYSFKII